MNWRITNKLLTATLAFVFLLHNSQSAANQNEPVFKELWTIENQFIQPESAAFDAKTRSVFVSNVNGYAKDGNGFVSRITDTGRLLELKWLDGLNSPTGMTVADNILYVVDFDELLEVSIATGQIIQRYPALHEKPALNDVVVSENGDVFVTGSASAAIYKLEQDQLIIWKQDDELLKHANGLFASGDTLLFGGAQWLVFDLESGEQLDIRDDRLIDIDGIASDGCNGYLITLIDDQRLWQVTSNGQSRPLSEYPLDGIDLFYHEDILYMPRVGGHVSALKLIGSHCQ